MVNKTLRALFITNGIFVLGANLLGPLYGLYVERIGGSVVQVSFAWAILMASTTLTYLCLTKFSKVINKPSTLLALGFLIRAFVWLSYSLNNNLAVFFALQLILGIGEAMGTLGFDVIFAEHLDKQRHVLDYAEWKLMENIILVAATLSGGFIVKLYGFTTLFVVMSGMAILSFAVFIVNRRLSD